MRFSTTVSVVGLFAVMVVAIILAMSEQGEPEPATPLAQGARLFRTQGCASCHAIGGGASRAPDLANLIPRLAQRLEPAQYQQQIAAIQARRPDVYKHYEALYTDILAHDGEDRIRAWLNAHLRNPRFDHPDGKMPGYSHLTQQQVDSLIEYLLTLR